MLRTRLSVSVAARSQLTRSLTASRTAPLRRWPIQQSRLYSSNTRSHKATTTRENTFQKPYSDEEVTKTPVGSRARKIFEAPHPHATRLTVEGAIECPLESFQLLNSPLFNKGSAFTQEEREAFNLEALLPPQVNTLDEQLERSYKQLCYLKTPLAKNDFMTSLRVQNKVLYFALIRKHIKELVPIIYTPTEGDAIAAYSHRFRKPEGVFLDITEPDSIERRLATYGGDKDVDYIVVSDSEGILGIGDQGIGGVRIAISKLALMTLCGGIHPGRVLPVCLDVGTNNKKLARDELYMGNKFSRIRGKQYDDFLEKFIKAVKKVYPSAVLHFEDFGVKNARRLLEKYRYELPSFNDDIQGTGAVVMASLIAALKHTNRDLKDTRVLIYGAGSAGLGIADQIVNHMVTHGVDKEEARKKIFLMDRRGLILQSYEANSTPAQHVYAKSDAEWAGINTRSLHDVLENVKPTCLVGCSTQAGAFTQDVVEEMHKHNPRPIIFPLSNPTRLHEAVPADLMKWTNNNALVATGSPFPPVDGYRISENNNCYSFPGIGLGAVLSRATTITDKMISAAVDQLAELSPLREGDSRPGLLPGLDTITNTSARLATAVVLQALEEGTARIEQEQVPGGAPGETVKVPRDFDECLQWVKAQMWEPVYRPMIKVQHDPSVHTNQL
ncbi:AIF_collapsed_G0030340.mRNA.1.CDS.1 [Saccharomyces cerevisiae]|nr:AIF_HP2_G0031750.mRNA.1.CDS.1 [Saccharomyces cerevisiae]CAI6595072.1 AIF_HP1_G0029450.mRNA.1.CDS.1 [Saccharomyces cerevisiae]CAI6607521.1 AIF_HP2_G0031750.mRNA.1.CDS.1 [Saccharomyces cerevisiae]CAI6751602.1 AIF_collapsed_G0030340.mRNA.1.CDS.1 [Saccharomyces cerevisiae]